MSFKKPAADPSDKGEENQDQEPLAMGNKPFEKVDPTDMANDSQYVDFFDEQRQKSKAFSHSTTKPVTYNVAITNDDHNIVEPDARANPDVAQSKKRSKSWSLGSITKPFRRLSMSSHKGQAATHRGSLNEGVTFRSGSIPESGPTVLPETTGVVIKDETAPFGKFMDRGPCPSKSQNKSAAIPSRTDPLDTNPRPFDGSHLEKQILVSNTDPMTSTVGPSTSKQVSYGDNATTTKMNQNSMSNNNKKAVDKDSHEAEMMRRKSSSIEEVYNTTVAYDEYNRKGEIPLATIVGTMSDDKVMVDKFNKSVTKKNPAFVNAAKSYNSSNMNSNKTEGINHIAENKSMDPGVKYTDNSHVTNVLKKMDNSNVGTNNHGTETKTAATMFDNVNEGDKHLFEKEHVNPDQMDISDVSKMNEVHGKHQNNHFMNKNPHISTTGPNKTLDPAVFTRTDNDIMNNNTNHGSSSLENKVDNITFGNRYNQSERSADETTSESPKMQQGVRKDNIIDDKIPYSTKKSLSSKEQEKVNIPPYKSLIPTDNSSPARNVHNNSDNSSPSNGELLEELPQEKNLTGPSSNHRKTNPSVSTTKNLDTQNLVEELPSGANLMGSATNHTNGEHNNFINKADSKTEDLIDELPQGKNLMDSNSAQEQNISNSNNEIRSQNVGNYNNSATKKKPINTGNDSNFDPSTRVLISELPQGSNLMKSSDVEQKNSSSKFNYSNQSGTETNQPVQTFETNSHEHRKDAGHPPEHNDNTYNNNSINPIKSMNISEPKDQDNEKFVRHQMEKGNSNNYKDMNPIRSMNISEPKSEEAEIYVKHEMERGSRGMQPQSNPMGSMNIEEPEPDMMNTETRSTLRESSSAKKQTPMSYLAMSSEIDPSLSSRRSLKSENIDDLDNHSNRKSFHQEEDEGESSDLKYHNSLVDPTVPTYGAVKQDKGDHMIHGSPMNYSYDTKKRNKKQSNLSQSTPRSAKTSTKPVKSTLKRQGNKPVSIAQ